jgi:hypothetical protein
LIQLPPVVGTVGIVGVVGVEGVSLAGVSTTGALGLAVVTGVTDVGADGEPLHHAVAAAQPRTNVSPRGRRHMVLECAIVGWRAETAEPIARMYLL